jgi:biotin transport system substrate-specific component
MDKQKKKLFSVQNMVLVATFTALIIVCSWIRVPIEPVPFTLQTFAIFVTSGLLGSKRGALSVIVYVLLGLVGVPVFAGFSAGPSVVAGPTGGFIVGFIFTAIVTGAIMKAFSKMKGIMKFIMAAVAMFIGDAVCFIIGTVWFMIIMNTGLAATFGICVLPYIIPDLVKIVVAVIVVDRMKRYVRIFD